MMMVDTQIRKLIEDGILYGEGISNGDMLASVSAISYDLHTQNYTNNEQVAQESCKLLPGESVFVVCKEIINMPSDTAARIVLRNSRIRQGFTLDAPVYQPGHHTRIFFRLTNVSSSAIDMKANGEYAALQFEKLASVPEKPYNGTFQREMSYSDMGDYSASYRKELGKADEKLDEIKHLERNIYTNIITLMSIFIALFSIIDINVDLAFADSINQSRLIISNLVTIGSIAFLVSLIQLCLAEKGKKKVWGWIMVVALAILGISAIIAL